MTVEMELTDYSKSREYLPSTSRDSTTINPRDVAGVLALLLADMYGLYFKTKDVHRLLSDQSIYKYDSLLDGHGYEILAAADLVAGCVQKLGGTLHRWPPIMTYLQKASCVGSVDTSSRCLVAQLVERNRELTARLREAKWVCDEYGDTDTATLLKECIKETDKRIMGLAQERA
jgi:starvation-inducible DNA-binding protein